MDDRSHSEAVEKKKRLRVMVIKEIIQTEEDFIRKIEMLCNEFLKNMRERQSFDPMRFSAKIISTVFCNIEAVLELHRHFLKALRDRIRDVPKFTNEIGTVFTEFRDQFKPVYSEYGLNHEEAQRTLNELMQDQHYRAFFQGCMLMGGQKDQTEEIHGYLLAPLQRVCKYPLLVKELAKYTPADHDDYKASKEAVDAMKDVCSVINETKRRMEKLVAIAEWQTTVEGWEGSNITDTCNEMVKQGSLMKISSGNTQERWFFLFDNLLVYCKKNSSMSTRRQSKKKTQMVPENFAYTFKGRIPLSKIEIENIEDGTADYHSSGTKVVNGWKVHNDAKRKWFVCIAKTKEDKSEWMEAILTQRDKRTKLHLLGGSALDFTAAWSLIQDKGMRLHGQMRDNGMIKDRTKHLRTHHKSFVGSEFAQWLVNQKEVSTVEEAVTMGQALLDNGIIHHVNDRHSFKNANVFYRFRFDDGTFKAKHEMQDLLAKGSRVYVRLHSQFPPPLKDHSHHLKTFPFSITGNKLIDWLIQNGDVCKRDEALSLGQGLIANGFLHHVTDKNPFKDDQTLYKFIADEEKKDFDSGTLMKKKDFDSGTLMKKKDFDLGTLKKGMTTLNSRMEFHETDSYLSRTIVVPSTEEGNDFEVEDTEPITVSCVVSGSPAEVAGLKVGDEILAVNGHLVAFSTHDEVLAVLRAAGERTAPLKLLLLAKKSHTCDIIVGENGLGFDIRGHNPVFISSVDKGGPAANAGLMPGNCILQVNGQDVAQAGHTAVVTAIIEGSAVTRSLSKRSGENDICNSDDDERCTTPVRKDTGFSWEDDIYSHSPKHAPTSSPKLNRRRIRTRLGSLTLEKPNSTSIHTDFRDLAVLGGLQSPASDGGKKSTSFVSITVGIGGIDNNSRYAYESAGGSRIFVLEKMLESKYCFTISCQLLKLFAAEDKELQERYNSLENVCTTTSEDDREEFERRRHQQISRLKDRCQYYELVMSRLSLHLWPTFKPSHARCQQVVSPCPTNCHIQLMEVTVRSGRAPAADSVSFEDGDDEDNATGITKVTHCFITCGAMAAHHDEFFGGGLKRLYSGGHQHMVAELRQIVHDIDTRLADLESDQELISRVVAQTAEAQLDMCLMEGEQLIASMMAADGSEDLPASFRKRTLSEAATNNRDKGSGAIRVAVNSLLTKAEKFSSILHSDRVLKTFKRSSIYRLVKRKPDMLFSEHMSEVDDCMSKVRHAQTSRNDDILLAAVSELLTLFKKWIPEVKLRLDIMLVLEEDLALLKRRDTVFCQTLATFLTGFTEQLSLALDGLLNSTAEYCISSKSSADWLDQLSHVGVLALYESLLDPSKPEEMGALEDMAVGIDNLRQVSLRMEELPSGSCMGDCIPLRMEGRRQSLMVILSLDNENFQKLPQRLQAGGTIKVHPVLVSHALHSLVVSDHESDQEKARGLQLSVNVEAVSALKQYYRKFRSFHLDKNKMPDTSAAKVALLDKILKPLNALEELMRAVETSMKIHQENVGFLSLCTELGSRMGATLVLSCLKGTDATAMSLTLEQVILLTRCHGLPPKSFQTALSVMRSQGVRIHNNKKNTNIPKFAFTGALPPRLYFPPASVLQSANQTP